MENYVVFRHCEEEVRSTNDAAIQFTPIARFDNQLYFCKVLFFNMLKVDIIMRIGLFILVFILLEVASFIFMADLIGGGYTLLLVLVSIIAGVLLLRQLGLSAGFTQMQAMRTGQFKPSTNKNAPMHLWLVGLLLIIPGFFSDLLALLLLIPQVRAALSQALNNAFLNRAAQAHAKAFRRGPANEGVTIDGECNENPGQGLPNKDK